MANNSEQTQKAMTDMIEALGEAADAAMEGGSRRGVSVSSLSGMSTAELKAMLPDEYDDLVCALPRDTELRVQACSHVPRHPPASAT